MSKLKELDSIMTEMDDFVELHYGEDISPLLIAEYKSLLMMYAKVYRELEDEGVEIPEFSHISDLTDEEWEERLEWMQNLIDICRSYMTPDEREGKITLN